MDYASKLALEHAKLQAQQIADTEKQPVRVIKIYGTFHTILGTATTSEDEVLYTAHPTIYEELTPRAAIVYNGNQVRFTEIRTIVDDEGNDAVMETTKELWSVEYARKVQSFLNKVL
jgi:hypothetical protein